MDNQLTQFYLNQPEPNQSTLLAIREIILHYDYSITATIKYGMPFFCYKGKMFCYLWKHKKYGQPYIGFVEGKHLEHPALLAEKRSRMKILLIDPDKDIPLNTINYLLGKALILYQNGTIVIK
jgi:hypothetical protein